jgi:sirohydrochlorin ferrochelatase
MTALIVFAHGSSIESANEEVRGVSADLAEEGGYPLVKTAFLEGGKPDLAEAVNMAAAAGATRVIVLPYFLTLGLHLRRDLPKLIDQVRAIHPDVVIEAAEPLDGHKALVGILIDRARAAFRENR